MNFSRPNLIFLAAAGSAALMIGALLFQYVGEMAPCKLCYWQRYPHVAAIVIGVLALAIPGRGLPLLGVVLIRLDRERALRWLGVALRPLPGRLREPASRLAADVAEGIAGGAAYDARVLAEARAGGAERLLTLNRRDFERLAPAGIEIVTPDAAAS